MSKPEFSRILAIDPGDAVSGWVLLDVDEGRIYGHANAMPNSEVLRRVRAIGNKRTLLVVETFQPRGMPLYWQLVWTAVWTGRFVEAWEGRGGKWDHLYREDAKHHVTGRTNASDSNVRAALIDRWGGRARAVGKKGSEGPLKSLAKHAWPALAVAVAYAEGRRSKTPDDRPKPVRRSSSTPPAVGARQTPRPPIDPKGRPIRRTR